MTEALGLALELAPASPSLFMGAGTAFQRPLGPVCSDSFSPNNNKHFHVLRTCTDLVSLPSHGQGPL